MGIIRTDLLEIVIIKHPDWWATHVNMYEKKKEWRSLQLTKKTRKEPCNQQSELVRITPSRKMRISFYHNERCYITIILLQQLWFQFPLYIIYLLNIYVLIYHKADRRYFGKSEKLTPHAFIKLFKHDPRCSTPWLHSKCRPILRWNPAKQKRCILPIAPWNSIT